MTTKPAQTRVYIFLVVHLLAGYVSNISVRSAEYSERNMHFAIDQLRVSDGMLIEP